MFFNLSGWMAQPPPASAVPLARAGVEITDEQIKELEEHVFDIDYDGAEKKEAETRHDVMAHVYTYGEVAPKVGR